MRLFKATFLVCVITFKILNYIYIYITIQSCIELYKFKFVVKLCTMDQSARHSGADYLIVQIRSDIDD